MKRQPPPLHCSSNCRTKQDYLCSPPPGWDQFFDTTAVSRDHAETRWSHSILIGGKKTERIAARTFSSPASRGGKVWSLRPKPRRGQDQRKIWYGPETARPERLPRSSSPGTAEPRRITAAKSDGGWLQNTALASREEPLLPSLAPLFFSPPFLPLVVQRGSGTTGGRFW